MHNDHTHSTHNVHIVYLDMAWSKIKENYLGNYLGQLIAIIDDSFIKWIPYNIYTYYAYRIYYDLEDVIHIFNYIYIYIYYQ